MEGRNIPKRCCNRGDRQSIYIILYNSVFVCLFVCGKHQNYSTNWRHTLRNGLKQWSHIRCPVLNGGGTGWQLCTNFFVAISRLPSAVANTHGHLASWMLWSWGVRINRLRSQDPSLLTYSKRVLRVDKPFCQSMYDIDVEFYMIFLTVKL